MNTSRRKMAACIRKLGRPRISTLTGIISAVLSTATVSAQNPWWRSFVPIGHGLGRPGVPLTIAGIYSDGVTVSADGWYRYIQSRDPVVLHGKQSIEKVYRHGKQEDERIFYPVATFEVATQDKTKWRKLREDDLEQAAPDTITVSPDNPIVNVRIDMRRLREWIGTYRYGRVLLENGDSAVIGLEDLLPTADGREDSLDFKESVSDDEIQLEQQGLKNPRPNDPAVLFSVTSLAGKVFGDLVFASQRGPTAIEGKRTLDGYFWPKCALQAGNSDEKWKTIGESPNRNGTKATLKITADGGQEVRVSVTKFLPLIGKYNYGRVIFSNGESGTFYLKLLNPRGIDERLEDSIRKGSGRSR
jgi:hypothetical protein